jgi:general secretion pathway protein G
MELNTMDANRGIHKGTFAPRNGPAVTVPGKQRQTAILGRSQQGLTLVELIVTVAILGILASVAYPIARFQIQRQKEHVLRDDLWTMRHAIDKYKDAADRKAFQVSIDSNGYPPDMDTLVNGVDVQGKKVKFLRQIPVDPMTGKKDWVLRSMQDDPDSDSWGGQDVFDVHSASDGTGLDGTKYNTW